MIRPLVLGCAFAFLLLYLDIKYDKIKCMREYNECELIKSFYTPVIKEKINVRSTD